jgi:EcsC protein family
LLGNYVFRVRTKRSSLNGRDQSQRIDGESTMATATRNKKNGRRASTSRRPDRNGRHQNGSRKKARLTDYEAKQVDNIAAWKSQPPNPLSEMWSIITKPAAKLVGAVIPEPLVQYAVERADDGAWLLASEADIKLRAGIEEISEMHDRPMEECDRMAHHAGFNSLAIAIAEGAATGAGGLWTTLIDVPLAIVVALRTIRKIGHCYGYSLEGDEGRKLVLGILSISLSGSLDLRRQRLKRLRDLESMVAEQSEEEIFVQEIVQFAFQLEIFEGVPGICAISGALLNAEFMHRVEVAARRVFQEHWLRDNGKVQLIEPAAATGRALAPGLSGAFVRAVHNGIYCVGFGAALPVYLMGSVLGSMNGAMAHGIREGAAAAIERSRRSVTWASSGGGRPGARAGGPRRRELAHA